MPGQVAQPALSDWLYSGYQSATQTALVSGSGFLRAIWLASGTAAANIIVDTNGTNLIRMSQPTEGSDLWILPTPLEYSVDLGVTLAGTGSPVYGVWLT